MKKLLGGLALLTLVTAITACSGTPTLEEKPSSEFTGLNKVSHSGFREAWARPGANLSGYRVIQAGALRSDRTQVVQPPSSGRIQRDWKMTSERQEAMAQNWSDAMHGAAKRQGLDSSGSGEQVLRIEAELTRIAPSANLEEIERTTGRCTVYTENSGAADIDIRLYDQSNGQLLAVIRDRRTIGPNMWSWATTVSAAADVRCLFNSWSNQVLSLVMGKKEPLP